MLANRLGPLTAARFPNHWTWRVPHFRGIAAGVGLAVAVWAQTAPAQSASNRAAAQALFDQAKAMVKNGDAANACPRFEESLRLDPGIGTQFNLADCYERIGKTASAWTLFIEVAVAAKQSNRRKHEQVARQRAAKLEGKLSKLVINVPDENRAQGLVVERGGEQTGQAQWGIPIPIDPGVHQISAEAPGKTRWEGTVTVEAGGATATLIVPELADAPKDAILTTNPAPRTETTDDASESNQRLYAYITGGTGVVLLGVGTFFGLQAVSKNDDSKQHCDGDTCRDQAGVDLRSEAQTAGNISTAAFIVGGAAVAGGVVLYLTAPDPSNPSETEAGAPGVALRGSVTPSSVSAVLSGAF